MKKGIGLVIFIVMVLGLWGAMDFYNYSTFGIETLRQYMGTESEVIIRELISKQLQNGIFKWLLATGIVVVSFVQNRKVNMK